MNRYLIFTAVQVLLSFSFRIVQAQPPADADLVTVRHLGHTSFLITDRAGTVIVTDPFLSGYNSPFPDDLSVDAVLISASGADHDAAFQLRGKPAILGPGDSSERVGSFQVDSFPIKPEADLGARTGYAIRHGEVKLLFLGEVDQMLAPTVVQLADDAHGVLVGFAGDRPARQLAASNLRTLVAAWVKPGSQPPDIVGDRKAVEKDTLEIGAQSPRQVVKLTTKAREAVPAIASGYSIFRDTFVELTWPQLERAASEKALVLVPVGVIEEHGPHMGLAADTYLTHLHCRRLKSALAALGTKALVAPPLYWGIADDTTRIPGSINVRPETMTALITDLCRSLKAWGFRRAVFVNEHGNRNHRRTLLEALSKVRQELDLEVFSLDAMITGAPVYQAPRSRYDPDYHAGAAETGVMWREFPTEVDTRLAQRLKPQPDFLPLGYVGDPASYRQEEALSDYLKQAPEYDARRILAFFSLKTGSEAPRKAPANLDAKARTVTDRYLQAAGGHEKLEAIRSQRRSGHMLEGNRTIPLEGLWSAEGKWTLALVQAPDVTERFGFNGSFGWHAERGEVGQLPEALVTVIALALDPQLALRLTGLLDRLAEAEGSAAESGRDVLEGQTASGMKVRLVFDSETGLLIRFNDTVFEDYREVEGVKYPFSVTVRPGTRVQFNRIENSALPASADFEPPK